MDRLWSPWRLEYVTADKKPATGCVFCAHAEAALAAKAGEAPLPSDVDSLIVFEGVTCYVVLNKYPYNNGHLMVVPYRHVESLALLEPAELHELADLMERSETALREAYQPQGINIGINLGRPAGAGILEHLHVHAVPRWIGDSNFMTVIGETRVLPEDLAATASRLRPVFDRLNNSR